MPMLNKPSQTAYADIADSAPPYSPASFAFDNGTGRLDAEVMAQITQTGRVPLNIKRTKSIDAVIASARAVASGKPQVMQGPSRVSVHPAYEHVPVSKKEKRYGSQDHSLTPAPLSLPSRKKSAGIHLAGPHSPIAPVPPPKDRSSSSRASSITLHDKYLSVPSHQSTTSKKPRSYPSQQLLHLQHQASLHRSHPSRARRLNPQTRIPTKQGRHLLAAADRPPPLPSKSPDLDQPWNEATFLASVAAGRSIWASMRTHPIGNGLVNGYAEPWTQSHSAVVILGGRKSIWEGHWLRRRTVRGDTSTVGKSAKSEADFTRFVTLMTSRVGKWWNTRKLKREESKTEKEKEKEKTMERVRMRAKSIATQSDAVSVVSKVSLRAAGEPGSLNNRLSRMYIDVARAGSQESVAQRQQWWKRDWRYTSGYWERVRGKKATKGTGKGEEKKYQAKVNEEGLPLETSGWYDSDDE